MKDMTMNLPDLVTKPAEKEKLTQRDAEGTVKLIFHMFTHAMKTGGRIEIRGFGSFVMREYGTYTGRNPKTGEEVEIMPKRLPFFKVGKELRERINDRSISG